MILCIRNLQGSSNWHVVPIDDLRDHDLSLDCWCKPTVEEGKDGPVIVHNSMNGREAFEEGKRKPS